LANAGRLASAAASRGSACAGVKLRSKLIATGRALLLGAGAAITIEAGSSRLAAAIATADLPRLMFHLLDKLHALLSTRYSSAGVIVPRCETVSSAM
jgi:hypothetical protein